MSRCLVTGGAGFIGSHLVEALVKNSHRVSVLDDFSSGEKENLNEVLSKIELVSGDVRNLKLVKELVDDVDFVYHLAAIPSVSLSIEDPLLVNEVNASGTLNVLEASRQSTVKRVIFASSCAVYGDEPTLPKKEESKTRPLSLYALTKLVGEEYCQIFARTYKLKTTILRYFNVYGPKQDPASEYAAVIPRFIDLALRERPVSIYGDGKQSRDFVYVGDVVRANQLAMESQKADRDVFNIGSGKSITVNQLVDELNEILSSDIKPVHETEREGDIKHSLADISKASEVLGYVPKVGFEDGLKETINWYYKTVD